jgi:opacity protein-like surface antigen
MKSVLLATLATLTMGTSALSADDNGLYLGLGYAATNIDIGQIYSDPDKQQLVDASTDSIMFIAGYDFNKYIGVEGRYYLNASSAAFDYYLGDTPLEGTYKAESFTLYAKPQYNLGLITLYGLVGVAFNDYTLSALFNDGSNNEAIFSWGGGAKFNVTQSLGLFVDYTDLGESTNFTTTNLSSWNLGVSYRF